MRMALGVCIVGKQQAQLDQTLLVFGDEYLFCKFFATFMLSLFYRVAEKETRTAIDARALEKKETIAIFMQVIAA